MTNPELKKLKALIKYDSSMLDWIDDNIGTIHYSQLIINDKYMSTEYLDMIKTEMINRIAEQIVEEAAIFKKTKTGYSLDLYFIKKHKKEK